MEKNLIFFTFTFYDKNGRSHKIRVPGPIEEYGEIKKIAKKNLERVLETTLFEKNPLKTLIS